jgi:murein DD-endopeptidase MepM/ murein hydrolase activator NlpD
LYRKLISCAVLLTVVVALSVSLVRQRRQPRPQIARQPLVVAASAPTLEPLFREIAGTFAPRQTVTDALRGEGLPGELVYQIVESTRKVYNLAKVQARQPYKLTLSADGDFHEFRYDIDDERYLTVRREGEDLVPELENFAYETRVEPVSGVIEGSLFETVTGLGEQERLALDLAEIFMWDVDFHTDIQKGDSFRLLVEKKYLDGEFKKYGTILAAHLSNEGKEFSGFRFQDRYYDARGEALKKSFLKSPLKFARISSYFSHARRHPVLKIVRPHLGVDYAAPTGTPVVAVGTGTVTMAGRRGANGNMVRVRHARGYETLYLHLSRIAVRAGRRVTQGQVIGYVGSTGLSSGPHLDFRVSNNGKFVNPLKVVFPPDPPVPAPLRAEFAALRAGLEGRLQQIGLTAELID